MSTTGEEDPQLHEIYQQVLKIMDSKEAPGTPNAKSAGGGSGTPNAKSAGGGTGSPSFESPNKAYDDQKIVTSPSQKYYKTEVFLSCLFYILIHKTSIEGTKFRTKACGRTSSCQNFK